MYEYSKEKSTHAFKDGYCEFMQALVDKNQIQFKSVNTIHIVHSQFKL